jgi:DNA-binding response OmpR family regulator
VTEHILVIEKDPALVENLIATLLRCGFKAEAVGDGLSAIFAP